MDEMNVDVISGGIAVAALLISLLLFIRILVVGGRLKKLRKQYVEVMGNTGVTNVEDVIIGLKQALSAQAQQIEGLQAQLNDVQQRQKKDKGRVGVVRYNAFADQGSDLSFAIAVVNDSQDGVVLSGIHSRDNTYVYAKPLEKGESSYPLTPEERKAIGEAK